MGAQVLLAASQANDHPQDLLNWRDCVQLLENERRMAGLALFLCQLLFPFLGCLFLVSKYRLVADGKDRFRATADERQRCCRMSHAVCLFARTRLIPFVPAGRRGLEATTRDSDHGLFSSLIHLCRHAGGATCELQCARAVWSGELQRARWILRQKRPWFPSHEITMFACGAWSERIERSRSAMKSPFLGSSSGLSRSLTKGNM